VIFLDKYKKYWENRDKDDEVMDDSIYVTAIDRAIGYLLIKCEKLLKKDEFNFFQVFLMRIRNELNDMKNDWRYSETTLAHEFPKDMNEICMNRFKVSDMFKDNPTLTCMLVFHICRWLYQESFTGLQLNLNVTELA
jgi:hypothetical protein